MIQEFTFTGTVSADVPREIVDLDDLGALRTHLAEAIRIDYANEMYAMDDDTEFGTFEVDWDTLTLLGENNGQEQRRQADRPYWCASYVSRDEHEVVLLDAPTGSVRVTIPAKSADSAEAITRCLNEHALM